MKLIWRISLVLTAFVALWCFFALLFGLKVKQQYRHFLSVINHNTPFNVKLVKFKSGIFTSSAVTEIVLGNLESNSKLKWQMHTKFIHGPIVLDRIKISFLQLLAETELVYIGSKLELIPKVTGEMKLSWGGRLKFKLKSREKFHILAKKSLVFKGEINKNNLELEWHLPNLSIEGKKHLRLQNGNLNLLKYYSTSDGLWFGIQKLFCEQFEIKDSKSNLSLKEILINNNLKKEDGLFVFELDSRLKQANYDNKYFNNNNLNILINTPCEKIFREIVSNVKNIRFSNMLEMLERILRGPMSFKFVGSSNTYLGSIFLDLNVNCPLSNRTGLISNLKNVDLVFNLRLHRQLFLFLLKGVTDNSLSLYQRGVKENKLRYDISTDTVCVVIRYFNGELLVGDVPFLINF